MLIFTFTKYSKEGSYILTLLFLYYEITTARLVEIDCIVPQFNAKIQFISSTKHCFALISNFLKSNLLGH